MGGFAPCMSSGTSSSGLSSWSSGWVCSLRFWEVGDLELSVLLTGLGIGMMLGVLVYSGYRLWRER